MDTTNPLVIWFSIFGKAFLKTIIPAGLLIAGYVWLMNYYKRPINGKIIYYIIAFLMLLNIFGSIGDLMK